MEYVSDPYNFFQISTAHIIFNVRLGNVNYLGLKLLRRIEPEYGPRRSLCTVRRWFLESLRKEMITTERKSCESMP